MHVLKKLQKRGVYIVVVAVAVLDTYTIDASYHQEQSA